MKNQEQTNNNNILNDPTVANDPQAQVEVDDLPISGEQEDQVKGGAVGKVQIHDIHFTKICDRA